MRYEPVVDDRLSSPQTVLLLANDLPSPARFATVAFCGLGVLIALSSLGAYLHTDDAELATLLFHKAFWMDTDHD